MQIPARLLVVLEFNGVASVSAILDEGPRPSDSHGGNMGPPTTGRHNTSETPHPGR